jgi:hypothetical protein
MDIFSYVLISCTLRNTQNSLRWLANMNCACHFFHNFWTSYEYLIHCVVQILDSTKPKEKLIEDWKGDFDLIYVSHSSLIMIMLSLSQVIYDFGLAIHPFKHKDLKVSQS